MGIGSLVVSYSLLNKLKPLIRPSQRLDLRSVCGQHWNYGRWELGTGIVYWIGENISMLFTGVLLGVGEVGSLKALMNLALPPSHVVVAMGRLTQPHTSRVFEEAGPSAAAVSVRTMARLFLIGGLDFSPLLRSFMRPFSACSTAANSCNMHTWPGLWPSGWYFRLSIRHTPWVYGHSGRPLLCFCVFGRYPGVGDSGYPVNPAFRTCRNDCRLDGLRFWALVAGVFLFRYKLRTLTKRVENFDPQPPEFIATSSLKI